MFTELIMDHTDFLCGDAAEEREREGERVFLPLASHSEVHFLDSDQRSSSYLNLIAKSPPVEREFIQCRYISGKIYQLVAIIKTKTENTTSSDLTTKLYF